MNPLKKQVIALLILLTILSFFSALKAQDFEYKADSLVQSVLKDKNGPGAVFLVAKDGKAIYRKAFGKSNIELDVNLTTESVFQLGSMTKQFTAIAILMLKESGMLNLTDPITKYIPDYPFGDKITIHHLLTHTSGIKDFTKMKSIQKIAQSDLSPTELINFFKDEPADFAPGTKFEYNNSGYVILGYVIELLSGKTYENFIQKNIFEVVGMTHSRYASDVTVIKNRAYGYQKRENEYFNKNKISFTIPFSSGSLMSTVDDMLKWQNALTHYQLITANTTSKAYTSYSLTNKEPLTYGYGWHLKELNGIKVREHGGSIFGFKTMAVYVPSKDIYVIGLSNCDCNSPTQLIRDMAALALKML